MFDLLRDLFKSTEEKQQEVLTAYLDGALTPHERRQFEAQLAQDTALRDEVEQQRLIKSNLRQLPRRPVPGNFTLDPVLYGRPQPAPAARFYPVLKAATALTAFFFVLVLATDLLIFGASQPQAPAAMEVATEMLALSEAEGTRVVSETVVEEVAEPALEPVEEPMIALEVLREAEPTSLPTAAALAQKTEEAAPAGGAPGMFEAETVTDTLDAPMPPPRPAATAPIELRATSPMITGVIAADTEELPPSLPDDAPETLVEPEPPRPVSSLRILQIVLAVSLFLLILLTFLVRRQL